VVRGHCPAQLLLLSRYQAAAICSLLVDEELCALLLGVIRAGHGVANSLGGGEDLVIIAALQVHPQRHMTHQCIELLYATGPIAV